MVARLIAAGALIDRQDQPRSVRDRAGRRPLALRHPEQPVRRALHRRRLQLGLGRRVAAGLVSFALGTDTAGSGRVPAAFNNIVGLKPSRGLLSTARRRARLPLARLRVGLRADRRGRGRRRRRRARLRRGRSGVAPEAERLSLRAGPRPPRFRFGVPARRGARLPRRRARRGGVRRGRRPAGGAGRRARRDRLRAVPRGRAALLYDGPFVAERLEAAGRLLAENPERDRGAGADDPGGGARFDARGGVRGAAPAGDAAPARARAALAGVDFLVVPTTPTIYTIDEVEAEPLRLNASSGRYTNFVNLLNLSALAVPTGFRADGLPVGVTLIAPWGRDAALAGVRRRRCTGRRPTPGRHAARAARAAEPRGVGAVGRSRSRSPSSARTSRASR